MKNKLITFITIIVIISLAIIMYCIFEKTEVSENDFKQTTGIQFALTMNDTITDNSIWCGTFQLVWNDLKSEIAKQDIVFTPQEEIVENLNIGDFTAEELSEDSYYKKVGRSTPEVKKEIENAIKTKLNETSEILDSFDWSNPDLYILYTMLKKEFKFEYEFEMLENSVFANKYPNIKYFGIKENAKDEIRKQVEVLYYNSKEDFAIKLKTKQNDEVIIAKKPEGSTLKEIYNNIKSKQSNFTGNNRISTQDIIKIPNLDFKEKREFESLENKPFLAADGDECIILKALQTIEFELDKAGGRIKSEAGMQVNKTAAIKEPTTQEKREFLVDDTFAIFLQEKDKALPYFAAKISDITKFQ